MVLFPKKQWTVIKMTKRNMIQYLEYLSINT